jgi:hypothetical protein
VSENSASLFNLSHALKATFWLLLESLILLLETGISMVFVLVCLQESISGWAGRINSAICNTDVTANG